MSREEFYAALAGGRVYRLNGTRVDHPDGSRVGRGKPRFASGAPPSPPQHPQQQQQGEAACWSELASSPAARRALRPFVSGVGIVAGGDNDVDYRAALDACDTLRGWATLALGDELADAHVDVLLRAACSEGRPAFARALVALGANPHARDAAGNNAYDVHAHGVACEEMTHFLTQLGVTPTPPCAPQLRCCTCTVPCPRWEARLGAPIAPIVFVSGGVNATLAAQLETHRDANMALRAWATRARGCELGDLDVLLRRASSEGHVRHAETLVTLGANANTCNALGQSAHDLARLGSAGEQLAAALRGERVSRVPPRHVRGAR